MNKLIVVVFVLLFKKVTQKRVRHYAIKNIAKREKGFAYSKTIRRLYADYYGIKIGYGTYGGAFDISSIPVWGGVEIGNWCSFATNVVILRYNHPLNNFTSHPIIYDPIMKYAQNFSLSRNDIVIGHDVWIGRSVIICPNVKRIGNGAVIGAGSVVTKDIKPYSVVAGNPAREIRKRFGEEKIKQIEETQWWNLEFEELVNKTEHLSSI